MGLRLFSGRVSLQAESELPRLLTSSRLRADGATINNSAGGNAAAAELGGNGLFPEQDMTEETSRAQVFDVVSKQLGSGGWPAEIASAITFLASVDAGYVNGSDLVADGGFTA